MSLLVVRTIWTRDFCFRGLLSSLGVTSLSTLETVAAVQEIKKKKKTL